MSSLVKNEDQRWILKNKHQIALPFMKIKSKVGEKWITTCDGWVVNNKKPFTFYTKSKKDKKPLSRKGKGPII